MQLKQLTGQQGPVQKTLIGGERIYSRPDTAELIFLAQRAKTFQDWVRLGRFLHRSTRAQQKRRPEYRLI